MEEFKISVVIILILTLTLPALAQRKITLEDIFKAFKFRTNTLIKQWLPDEDAYTTLKYDSLSKPMAIYKYDLRLAKEEKIVSYAELDSQIPSFSKNVSAYFFSPNKKTYTFHWQSTSTKIKNQKIGIKW